MPSSTRPQVSSLAREEDLRRAPFCATLHLAELPLLIRKCSAAWIIRLPWQKATARLIRCGRSLAECSGRAECELMELVPPEAPGEAVLRPADLAAHFKTRSFLSAARSEGRVATALGNGCV